MSESLESSTRESQLGIACAVQNEPGKVITLILTYALSYILHFILKSLSQPRIVSEILVGMTLGSIKKIRLFFDPNTLTTINFIAEFGMICYTFVLALEMDPYVLLKPPSQDALIAYCGMAFPFLLACGITPFLHFFNRSSIGFTLLFSFILSGTSSHILTHLVTSLRIGKSDIGRLVHIAGVHTDMMSVLLICIGYLFFPPLFHATDVQDFAISALKTSTMTAALHLQIVFTASVSPIFVNWINNENPDGKSMQGPHLVISIAFMVMVCCASPLYGYSPMLSAFMAGLFLPRYGRISRWAVGKINYLLTTLYYPLFTFWAGYAADLSKIDVKGWAIWGRLLVLLVITIFGKMIGVVIGGTLFTFPWRESVDIGLLLSSKGYFQLFLTTTASLNRIISRTTNCMMITVILITVASTPSIVKQIIKRARKRSPTHPRKLQFLDRSNELRLLAGLHGLQNIASTINFMELCSGNTDPGIVVYSMDMIELTEQIAATLVRQEGTDTVTVTDPDVVNMREEITGRLQAYVDEKGTGITLRRMLALSTFNNMAQDICGLAEELKVQLLVLPFHKIRREDGTRGSAMSMDMSKSAGSFHVAVIFIGGRDDRESLAYASLVAKHQRVKLTVIRFLLDDNADNEASRSINNYRVNVAAQEADMKLDDECFADFYERYIAIGHVAYREKHLANSAETYTTLRTLDEDYKLIIVGQGMGSVNTVLTAGLSDWQQYPELGPIGDVLSGSDFSPTSSILIIQQHYFRGDLDGMDDEFSA
ncbi:hypothetical protein Tsubulata_004878, partial [Turnera subulata]